MAEHSDKCREIQAALSDVDTGKGSCHADCPVGGHAPVAVGVPPGTPLHGLARPADAPEVRREAVRGRRPLELHVAPVSGTVRVYGTGAASDPTFTQDEAARRLLAFDALVAAARRLRHAVSRLAGDHLRPTDSLDWGRVGEELRQADAALAAAAEGA